jgi:iron complex transport system substrate-binding protein
MRASRPLPLLLTALVLLLSAADTQARELVDRLGRRVRVPEDPSRVVALAPSITEIVFALGQQRRLVGVSTHSDYPEEAKRLPVVGSYVRPDLERILALKPDLCLAVKDGNPKALADRLESMGIPVYAVDPQRLEGILEAVAGLGEALGAMEEASLVVREMQRRIDRVRNVAETATTRPRVFYQIGLAPIVSSGSGTYIHEMIELAGGINLATGREPYPRFTPEDVLTLAPEVILVSAMRAEGFRAHEIWSRFRSVPAVRTGRVHAVDSDLFDRPSPRLVLALEEMARLLHPELFEQQLPGSSP